MNFYNIYNYIYTYNFIVCTHADPDTCIHHRLQKYPMAPWRMIFCIFTINFKPLFFPDIELNIVELNIYTLNLYYLSMLHGIIYIHVPGRSMS